ncbi:MAG: hypothetical protein PHR16_10255 [Methylovulum sp.]|nr:hypothetical protein [Methylovulum sp.]
MSPRFVLAMVCLLFALILGVQCWRADYLPISQHEGAGRGQWENAPATKGRVNAIVKNSSDALNADFYAAERKFPLNSGVSAAKSSKNNGLIGIDFQHQTTAQLWQSWKLLLSRSEFQQIPIIGMLLAEGLRKYPHPEIYRSIYSLLSKPDLPLQNKALLLDLLADIATPESLNQLVDLAGQETASPMRILVLQAISHIGDNQWDGTFHEELSPVLEAAWTNLGNSDQAFLTAVGIAIAQVGAPEGVKQLLLTLSGNNKNNDTEATRRIKQEVAFNAIPQIRNPNAVGVLDTWFVQEPPGTPAFEVSGNALAEIGSPEATQKIVDWAQKAPAEGARNLEDWLSKIDEPNSLRVMSAITQKMSFQSQEIVDVVNKFNGNIGSNRVLSASKVSNNLENAP